MGGSLSDVRQPARIFISHSNNDHALAMEVCALLELRGLSCWIGPRDVVPGKVWDEAILDAIDSTSIFLLILSSAANNAPFVKNEVNRAFTLGKPILTFRVEDVQPGRSLELYLARHHWTDGFSGRIEDRVEELVRAIAALPTGDGTVAAMATEQLAASKSKLRTLRSRRERTAWAVAAGSGLLAIAALATAAALLSGWRPDNSDRQDSIVSTLDSPSGAVISTWDFSAALSPDGRRAIFLARTSNGEQQLFLRELSVATPRALPGTEGGLYPFWSPDGQQVGFFADGKLKKLDLRGGAPQVIADAPTGRGGSWGRNDLVVYSRDINSGLFVVSAAGGISREVTRADGTSHRWPSFLPDGRHFLFLSVGVSRGGRDKAQLMIGDLEGEAPKKLVEDTYNGQYSNGYLLFGRAADLYAWRFDVRNMTTVGEPLPVPVEKLASMGSRRASAFSASANGSLLILPNAASERESRLTWVDRRGNVRGSVGPVDHYLWPRLSPNEDLLAFVGGKFFGASSLWVTDLRDGRRVRLSDREFSFVFPVWTADSRRIVTGCEVRASLRLCIKSLDDGADMKIVKLSENWILPGSVLRDGKTLLYAEQFPATGTDLMSVDLASTRPIPKLIGSRNGSQQNMEVSPDGRWLAYYSDESGNREIYVRPTSGVAQQWQISSAGGIQPRWTRGGRELLFAASNGDLMSVEVLDGPGFRSKAANSLFRLPEQPEVDRPIFEDVTADGERLLLNVPTIPSSTFGFRLVTNWPALLEQPKGD